MSKIKKLSLDVLPITDNFYFDLLLKEDGKVIDKLITNPRALVKGMEGELIDLGNKLGRERDLKRSWRFCALSFAALSAALYFSNKLERGQDRETIKCLKEENEWMESQIENPTDI